MGSTGRLVLPASYRRVPGSVWGLVWPKAPGALSGKLLGTYSGDASGGLLWRASWGLLWGGLSHLESYGTQSDLGAYLTSGIKPIFICLPGVFVSYVSGSDGPWVRNVRNFLKISVNKLSHVKKKCYIYYIINNKH